MRTSDVLDRIGWNDIAAQLAHLDATTQAEFINVFIEELTQICETRWNTELQLSYISDHLSEDAREYLKFLYHKTPPDILKQEQEAQDGK